MGLTTADKESAASGVEKGDTTTGDSSSFSMVGMWTLINRRCLYTVDVIMTCKYRPR